MIFHVDQKMTWIRTESSGHSDPAGSFSGFLSLNKPLYMMSLSSLCMSNSTTVGSTRRNSGRKRLILLLQLVDLPYCLHLCLHLPGLQMASLLPRNIFEALQSSTDHPVLSWWCFLNSIFYGLSRAKLWCVLKLSTETTDYSRLNLNFITEMKNIWVYRGWLWDH